VPQDDRKIVEALSSHIKGTKRKWVFFLKYLQIADPEYEGHPSEGRAAVLFVTLIIMVDPVHGEFLSCNYISALNNSRLCFAISPWQSHTESTAYFSQQNFLFLTSPLYAYKLLMGALTPGVGHRIPSVQDVHMQVQGFFFYAWPLSAESNALPAIRRTALVGEVKQLETGARQTIAAILPLGSLIKSHYRVGPALIQIGEKNTLYVVVRAGP
jgi:hypothetical protein